MHDRGDLLQGLTWDILVRGGSAWEREFTGQWWELLRPLLSASEETVLQIEVLWQRLVYRKARRGEISLEEARAAMERAFQALKPERSEVEAEQAISVCNSLGFLLMDDRLGRPDYPSARAWLERGLELLKQHWDRLRDPQEWEAILRGNLALLIARAEGRHEEAMRTLEEIRSHLRWKRDLAEWHLVMAVYAYRWCRIREALRYGREGDALLQELGVEKLDTKEGEE
jgi:tetratricopeptide (TPR) repeat protein